jgi:hypothetical protein
MSSGSLFESESEKGSNLKIFVIAFAAFAVLVGVGYGLYWYTSPIPVSAEEILAGEVRDNTVILLSQPSFSGDEANRQIFGKGRAVRFNFFQKEAYFTFPETPAAEFQEFLAKYFVDASKLDYGSEENGRIELGKYTLTKSPEAFHFFRTPLDNVRIDTKQNLTFPYRDLTYSASLEELKNLTNNSHLYGGKLVAQAPTRRDEPQMVFANHAIMVSKPEEPSLKRFADELLKDVDGREAKIQRLVDFVSNEIEYSFSEALMNRELLKRANETLMTRTGDCSNKTILLASLLEQIGEEYILLYCPRHITVAIPQGNFANDNKLDFEWNQKPWMIAETTAAGFQIGKSMVQDPNLLIRVNYVQDPKNSNVIFDANSYEVLKFF